MTIKKQFHRLLDKFGYHLVSNEDYYEHFDDYESPSDNDIARAKTKYFNDNPNTVVVLCGVWQRTIDGPISIAEIRAQFGWHLQLSKDAIAYRENEALSEDTEVNNTYIEFYKQVAEKGI